MRLVSRGQRTARHIALTAAAMVALFATVEVAELAGLHGLNLVSSAQAQRQGLGGGGQGAGSGGTSGGVAGPQGAGAGGSTAGVGNGVLGSSQGPGPVNQNRYGGRPNQVVPPPPTEETTTITNTQEYYTGGGQGGEGYLFGRADRCADFTSGRMTEQERVEGKNLERLNAAQHYLAPDFDPLGMHSALYLLANYQQELEKAAPDTLLAGTYLGLVSTRPVTAKLIDDVNLVLCITAAPKVVDGIASTADEQRRAQAKRAGTN